MSYKRILWIVNVFLPLFTGFAIYVFFRPDTIVSGFVYRVIQRFSGFENVEAMLTLSLSSERTVFGQFLLFYAPDMLWAYAFSSTLLLILGISRKSIVFTSVISICMVAFTESAQFVHIIAGTFDPLDILAEAVAAMFSIFTFILCVRRDSDEKQN